MADLTFETTNYMSVFVGLASGQLGRWIPVDQSNSGVEAPHSAVERELLSLWRSGADPRSCESVAGELSDLLKKVTPIRSHGWIKALKGDGSAAVRIAIQITNNASAGRVSRDVDIAMSLVFLHASQGVPGAGEVLDVLKGRLAARLVDMNFVPDQASLL